MEFSGSMQSKHARAGGFNAPSRRYAGDHSMNSWCASPGPPTEWSPLSPDHVSGSMQQCSVPRPWRIYGAAPQAYRAAGPLAPKWPSSCRDCPCDSTIGPLSRSGTPLPVQPPFPAASSPAAFRGGPSTQKLEQALPIPARFLCASFWFL